MARDGEIVAGRKAEGEKRVGQRPPGADQSRLLQAAAASVLTATQGQLPLMTLL